MSLFDEAAVPRPVRELAPGAVWVPNWLTPDQQRWLVARFHEWTRGPVPLRAAKVRGHEMSVKTVCLGWHWRPYEYTRAAVDVNGNRVLDFPDWMVRLGREALLAAYGTDHPVDTYSPDTALVNFYDQKAKMGMHQDRDEVSADPVVSLSIGDSCRFRFGNTSNRNKPYTDIELASGDLFVFGGESRFAFHGVTRTLPGTAPQAGTAPHACGSDEGCGLVAGRINITMRVTGLAR